MPACCLLRSQLRAKKGDLLACNATNPTAEAGRSSPIRWALSRNPIEKDQPMKEFPSAVIETLSRHSVELAALRTLAVALIQTHPDRDRFLERFLDLMEICADTLGPDATPQYREAMNYFVQAAPPNAPKGRV